MPGFLGAQAGLGGLGGRRGGGYCRGDGRARPAAGRGGARPDPLRRRRRRRGGRRCGADGGGSRYRRGRRRPANRTRTTCGRFGRSRCGTARVWPSVSGRPNGGVDAVFDVAGKTPIGELIALVPEPAKVVSIANFAAAQAGVRVTGGGADSQPFKALAEGGGTAGRQQSGDQGADIPLRPRGRGIRDQPERPRPRQARARSVTSRSHALDRRRLLPPTPRVVCLAQPSRQADT